ADADVLYGRQEGAHPGHLRERRTQPVDDPLGRLPALLQRLEADEHEGAVARTAAGESGHRIDRGILAQDGDDSIERRLHLFERDAVLAPDESHKPAGVLAREETLGDR